MEYWIDDTGQLTFADGDVGDYNHKAIALDFLTRQIFDYLDFDPETEEFIGAIDDYADQLAEFLECQASELTEKIIAEIKKIAEENRALNPEYDHPWLDEETRQAMVLSAFDYMDPCFHVIKHHGWIRIKGTNIEAWEITPETLKTIDEALWEIFEDLAEEKRFFLEQRKVALWWSDVSYEDIGKHSLVALRPYQND